MVSNDKQDSSIMDAVGSNVEGVASTLNTIYSRFEQSLNQSIQMKEGMANMIAQLYQANLKIASTLKPAENGNIRMSLIISNRTKLPAASLTGTLEFQTKEVDISYLDASDESGNPLPNLFQTPYTLAPEARYTQDIEIHLKRVEQYNGLVKLQLSNPFDDQKIEIQHSFGLYLIDQFKKEILDEHTTAFSDLEKVDKLYYPVLFMREIMEIHPIKGISPGMCIGLSSSKCKIVCEITNISEDLNTVEVEFASDNKELAQKLVVELSILCDL